MYINSLTISLSENQWITEHGYCLDSTGQDQNGGTKKLSDYSSGDDCLADCKSRLDATACEYHTTGGCLLHTNDVAAGNGDREYTCWIHAGKIKIKYGYQLDFQYEEDLTLSYI